jgi:hypothetical protein
MGTPHGEGLQLFFGNNAPDFPGPELLAAYNPTEHIIPEARNGSIAAIPGQPDVLLRWSPPNALHAKWIRRNGYENLEQAALDMHEQYVVLSALGLAVPSHRVFMGAGPDGTDVAGQHVAYTVVERVKDTRLQDAKDPRGAPVVESLARYLCSPSRKRTGRVARDIYYRMQYCGETLVDLEQLVSAEDNRPLGTGTALITAGKYVVRWAEVLGMIEHDDVQRMGRELYL